MGATAGLAFGTGYAAVKDGLNLIVGLRTILKKDKPDTAEILAGLNDLHESLCQARESLADGNEENRELKRQLEEQKKLLDVSADMEFVEEGQFYVRKSEKEAGKTIPYCPYCWKHTNKDVPLNRQEPGKYYCILHKVYHFSEGRKPGSNLYIQTGTKRKTDF